jgi:hypothetical protein
MRRAGCDVLYVGYETVDDSTADEWGKGYRGGNGLRLRQRLEQDTRILHDNGFWIHGMFVLGPGHGRQDAADILHFARRNKLETLQVSILTPLPGTPLFGQMRPHLLFTDFPQDWDYYDGGHCLYDHARLGLEGTQEVVLDVHRRFYGWGGWSWPRVRAFIRERLPLQDKLAMVWSNAGAARRVLRQWQEETKAFLTLARERASRRPGRQPAS